jgi:hypothetical protein
MTTFIISLAYGIASSLTPSQRGQALLQWFKNRAVYMGEGWFFLISIVTLITLVVLFVAVSYNRTGTKKQTQEILTANKRSTPDSRQIPIGKKLYLSSVITGNSTSYASAVIRNNDESLSVRLFRPLETAPGEFWRVQYDFGTSTWEFETDVVRCEANVLTLNHSDRARFVNRRRFKRVPVTRPAFIAQFPFAKTSPAGRDFPGASLAGELPKFVPADVTELAGPGLCLQAPLNVKVGDRVVVILKLNEENHAFNSKSSGKIVEDVGLVRRTGPAKNGYAIVVELTSLSDENINEMVQAANAASIIAIKGKNKAPVLEPATA